MLFRGKGFLSLKVRTLLFFIAAAGAGILFTYLAAKNNVEAMAWKEAGDQIFSYLKIAAAETDLQINADIEKARHIAAAPALRAVLERKPGEESLSSADKLLAEAAAVTPGAAALSLGRRDGSRAGSYKKAGAEPVTADTEGALPSDGESYVSPPFQTKGALSYEVSVMVPGAGGKAAGTLSCRFAGRKLPAAPLHYRGGVITMALARRTGDNLSITGAGKPAQEAALTSETARIFLPAIQGKEGYSFTAAGKSPALYAYARLPSADWLIAASTDNFPREVSSTTAVLARTRQQGWLLFALLAVAGTLLVNFVPCPLGEAARTAAALLDETSSRAEGGTGSDIDLIMRAMTEALTLVRRREQNGLELEKEAEKLREEDEDLKYQNLELDKLNKYLLERETKISELKKELRELQQRVETARKD